MPTPSSEVRTEPACARTTADDAAGTACEAQVREALRLVDDTGSAPLNTDARRSRLNANGPALLCLAAETRRGGLRRAVVRDLAHLTRSAVLLDTALGKLRAARMELVTAGRLTGVRNERDSTRYEINSPGRVSVARPGGPLPGGGIPLGECLARRKHEAATPPTDALRGVPCLLAGRRSPGRGQPVLLHGRGRAGSDASRLVSAHPAGTAGTATNAIRPQPAFGSDLIHLERHAFRCEGKMPGRAGAWS